MRLQHKYFHVNLRKFLRTILQIIYEWLLLTICCLNLQNLTKSQLKCLFQSLRKKKVHWMWGSEVIKTIMLKMNILKCFPRYLEWAVGNIVSDWVLIPLANINPASYVPLALKILICLPGHTNSPNNSNTMNMFNNNTYANFKTAYTLFLQCCHARELFGSHILVTTGRFEMWISYIWSYYLTHWAVWTNKLGGFRVAKHKGFTVWNLAWS